MAKQIAENLWCLEIPLEGNPLKTLNSYLITGERNLLIDTGFRWDSCFRAMERELEATGVDRDRMDIFVEVSALEFEELSQRERSESSETVRQRVNQARAIQRKRSVSIPCNAQLGQEELDKFCTLDEGCQRLMKGAFERMGLTARSYDRILRVARTIADLEGSEEIQMPHLAEALQYRPPEYLRR